MNRELLLNNVDEHAGTTYAEPLAGLRVSWGSILAGALGLVAISLLLWAFSAAITLSATHVTVGSIKGTLIALFVCSIATTLIGAFAGGWLAGYLPGNRSRAMGAIHGFLAWALAFVLVSGAGFGLLRGVVRTGADVAVTSAQANAAANAEPATDDQTTRDFLESLGYSRRDANAIMAQNRPVQRDDMGPSMGQMRHAFRNALTWTAGLTWAWFGTWLLSAVLAVAGALAAVRQLRPGMRIGTALPIDVIIEEPAHA